MTLFTAVAADYHVSARLIASLTGIQGLVIAGGAVVGGFVCDRIDRRMANVAGALLSAAATIPLLLGSYSRTTFALGMSLYAFAAGFCFAAFSALALELVGDIRQSASARYALFVAAANLPVAYMVGIDGQGHRMFGPKGLFAFDAAASTLAAITFFFLFRFVWHQPIQLGDGNPAAVSIRSNSESP